MTAGRVRITPTDDIAACIALRRAVFIDEQGIPEADEIDDRDGDALHLLAIDADMPVGTARLLMAPPVGRIGRVCVLPTHLGTGLGAALIGASVTVLQTAGMTRAVLGAQVAAMGFYAKLGFVPFGPVYDDAGIPHQDMERAL